MHPRTPVLWTDAHCMEFVDRSTETDYAFDYGVPYEDTDITADEVEDSRTHQFFAICRQTYLHEDLPQWITMADVEAAARNDADFVAPPDDAIFEFATDWEGCWHPISEDSDRRPITEAAASQPVTWDTATVPAGVYALLGYTYEPPFNLWSPRAGSVVRVYDGGDPAASGPAAAITSGQESRCAGDTVRIEGCISALPGTTMAAFYTTNPGPDPSESTWVPIAEVADVPVEGEEFSLEWDVPAEAAGTSAILRVDVIDPNGTVYTAYQYEPIIVLRSESSACTDEPVDCADPDVVDSACDRALGDQAGGCRVTGGAVGGWAVWLLGLVWIRRMQSAPKPASSDSMTTLAH